jgi:serine phosphatase RsbU (regulator of sigma subunit)/tetratricopeptide (TPR) repeat protein
MKSNFHIADLNNYILFYIFLFIISNSFSQNFGDKQFYLIDSLKLSDLSEQDRALLDSSLTKYHNTKEDTIKFGLLEHIIDECWDAKVWPKYNAFLRHGLNEKLTKTCSLQEKIKSISYLAGVKSNMGYLYDQKGDIISALDFYLQSLKLYEYVGDNVGTSAVFNNLGVIYSTVGDTSKSLEYHNKSLISKKIQGDLKGIAMSYNNIGSIYENSNQPFIALEYYESSLKLRKQINDLRGIAMSYDNIGDIYLSQDLYGKAYEFYNNGYLKWKEIGYDIGISTSLNNLANVLLKLNRAKEAKVFALESFEIAEKLGYPVDIENSSQTLVEIYKWEKNYQLALSYLDLQIDMKEKTRSLEKNKIALKKGLQYEYQKESLKDSLELEKERTVYHLRIQEKETQAYAMFSGMGLLIIILIIAIKSFLRKKKDNLKINEQKIEVESQKLEIENQHISLAVTHKEISDSISYAKRIQDAILPTKETLNHHLKNGFVLFLPKDVVSGDFYWIEKVGSEVVFAVADCTGHGVPGAMVSIVCHNALNRAVREFKLIEPADILDKSREIIIETFAHNSENVKDGMDISLCSWNTQSNLIKWSGANNPLYIIPNTIAVKDITIFSPDKQPVGKFELEKAFTQHEIQLKKGDSFYLFSDGFMDQFGGENGKKYKYSRFRTFILSINHHSMKGQGELLEEEFNAWKKNLEQLDDVCLIGVKI